MHRLAPAVLGSILLSSLGRASPVQVHQAWARIYDAAPTGTDEALAAAVAPSGAIYAAGRTGTNAVVTLKYSPSGSLAWARTFTFGQYIDLAYSVVVDPSDESVFAVGRADMHSQSTGGLVLKYDSSGTLSWSSVYHAPVGTAEFYTAQLLPNGNLVAGGSMGQGGMVVVEFDPQGNALWSGTAPGGDYPADLTVDASGNILVAGNYDEQGQTTHFGVSKFTSSGTFLWTRIVSVGGSGFETAGAVKSDASGAIYAAGRLFDPASGPNEALVKLDPDGNVLWVRMHRGTQVNPPYYQEGFHAIALAANGNVRVAGQSANVASEVDVEVLEYNPSGQLVWHTTWNGPQNQDDGVSGISTGADGSVTVLGATEGSSGSYDPLILRLDDQGVVRWAYVDALSGSGRAYAPYAAFGPGGVSVFAGTAPANSSSASDVLVIAEQDQSLAFCFGDGSSIRCPCGNNALPGQGRGCVNSLGDAARLTDLGEASLAGDTLVLTSSGEIPNAISIFLQGDSETSPAKFGDGLLCLGGAPRHLYAKRAATGSVSAPTVGDPSISARSAALGDTITAGSTRFYQVYYRDSSASFCPPPNGSAWNLSSGLAVVWVQ